MWGSRAFFRGPWRPAGALPSEPRPFRRNCSPCILFSIPNLPAWCVCTCVRAFPPSGRSSFCGKARDTVSSRPRVAMASSAGMRGAACHLTLYYTTLSYSTLTARRPWPCYGAARRALVGWAWAPSHALHGRCRLGPSHRQRRLGGAHATPAPSLPSPRQAGATAKKGRLDAAGLGWAGLGLLHIHTPARAGATTRLLTPRTTHCLAGRQPSASDCLGPLAGGQMDGMQGLSAMRHGEQASSTEASGRVAPAALTCYGVAAQAQVESCRDVR